VNIGPGSNDKQAKRSPEQHDLSCAQGKMRRSTPDIAPASEFRRVPLQGALIGMMPPPPRDEKGQEKWRGDFTMAKCDVSRRIVTEASEDDPSVTISAARAGAIMRNWVNNLGGAHMSDQDFEDLLPYLNQFCFPESFLHFGRMAQALAQARASEPVGEKLTQVSVRATNPGLHDAEADGPLRNTLLKLLDQLTTIEARPSPTPQSNASPACPG
jgi:hypothetical protein